jgi:hypothetical protein
MSNLPDNELDLEKLFLPAWAQQEPSSAKYAKYEVTEDRSDRYGDRRSRPPRRDGAPGGRRDGGGGRPSGDRRGPRPEGGRPRPGGPGGSDRQENRFGDRRERREPPAPMPEINLSLVPEEKGVDSLARQIRMSGRAYPLFDIAQMILQKPERQTVTFTVKKNAEGKPVQPLFVCALDDSLWLSEDAAIAHVLAKHFGTFYQAERTATEPPKGKYTFVAQCGFSGVILGPPNHHDYQTALRRLHAERFSRMPFEAFKSRVKIVRDEEVVKKWVEEQSFRTEFVCLNLPEPPRLGSMEAVEKHFRETHKENIIKQVESHTLAGATARNLRCPELARLVRSVWDDQRRFPLQIATVLSQQFASRGLQFFKVNKTVTHVCVARPHFLDLEAAPVSDGIRRIVEYINSHSKCNRKLLVESLAPTPVTPIPIPVPAPVPVDPAQAPAEAPAAAAVAAAAPTAEQTAVISDLHWLIHQGHVIEFANGILETAKKPLPKPPKPEPKPKAPEITPAPAVTAEAAAAPSPEAPTETSTEPTAEASTTPAPEAAVISEEAPVASTAPAEVASEAPAPVAAPEVAPPAVPADSAEPK